MEPGGAILSWNVNSLKTLRQYHPWTDTENAGEILRQLGGDLICVQETKLSRDKIDAEWALIAGWDSYFAFSRRRKG